VHTQSDYFAVRAVISRCTGRRL